MASRGKSSSAAGNKKNTSKGSSSSMASQRESSSEAGNKKITEMAPPQGESSSATGNKKITPKASTSTIASQGESTSATGNKKINRKGSTSTMAPQGESTSAIGNTKINRRVSTSIMPASQGESSSKAGNKKKNPKGSHDLEISQVEDIISTYFIAQGDDGDKEAKDRFEEEFVQGDPETDVILDVLFGAINLEHQDLIDIACQKVADRMKNKSVEWVRKAFEIESDLTAEEEAETKAQNPWAFEGVDPDKY